MRANDGTRTAAEVLVDQLVVHGVRHMFCVPGESYIAALDAFHDRDIAITFTGIRPGEKLFEELSTDQERAERTRHAQVFIGRVQAADPEQLERGIEALRVHAESADTAAIVATLRELIPEYAGASPIGASVIALRRPSGRAG